MWAEITRRWNEDPNLTLVLPGNLARDSFLRSLGADTVWNPERVLTLGDLWRRLAGQLDGLPVEIYPAELEPRLAELVEGYPRLSVLLDTTLGLDMLGQHLEEIDRQADLDYHPGTEVEREIAKLRKEMLSAGAVTSSALRSAIARRAKEINLHGALLFTPLPEPSRQLGGLLKGLGRQNLIELEMIGPAHLCRITLERADLLSETEIISDPSGSVDTLWTSSVKRNPGASFYRADDTVPAAISLAKGFIDRGFRSDEVAIISPEGEATGLAFEAEIQGLPILIREAVETRETPVGSTLLRLADLDLRDPYACRRALTETGLPEEDLEALRQAEETGQGAKLRALHELGGRMLRYHHQPGQPLSYDRGRSASWLDALGRVADSLEVSKTEPWDISTILSGVRSARLPRGERTGVKVLSPAEAPSYRIGAAVFLGLEAGSYPGNRAGSPFVSRELLHACPQLGPRDLRPEFAASLASASSLALLRAASVRGSERIASPFYLEALRAFDAREEKQVTDGNRRYQARRQAARRQGAAAEIEQALDQAKRELIPSTQGGSRPSDYSVTELETYLRCPYGWFVQSVIRPRTPGSAQAIAGSIVHGVMERLLGGEYDDPGERLEVLPDVIAELADGRLPESDLPLIEARIGRLLERYSGPAWPLVETLVEEPLRKTYERDGDELTIRGRADRIDFLVDPESGDRELLVIDYKSNSPPRASYRLQPFLYPRMAAEVFAAGIIGFAYLSVRSGRATAHLSRPTAFLEERGGPSWGAGETRALRSVQKAVEGIESGLWSEVGKNCPVWCPHRHLSESGVLK